jgi:hypothetical protein
VIEPIHLAFEVDCPVEHAFHVWTGKISQWWPLDHTVSAQAGLMVVLEGRPSGRIFERQPGAIEYDWGEVTSPDRCPLIPRAWNPGVLSPS